MQIEKAEYLHNQTNLRRSFEFKRDKLNLLALDEDDAKTHLFESICEVIWGHEKEASNGTNGNGRLKEGCLVFQVDGKTLELSRDFASNNLQMKSSSGKSPKDPADLFSGITKEIFSSLFLVAQDENRSVSLAEHDTRLNLLGQFASLSEDSSDIDKAVKLIEEKIERYPFREKNYKIDDLINGLNRGKLILQERLTQLEKERQDTAAKIDELKTAQDELASIQRRQKREEYFQLCLETAELDARIMKVQQRLLYEAELKRDLQSLGDLASFPISAVRKAQELFTMRQARISDMERLQEEINAGERESELLHETLSKESEGLDEFSIEDAQQIYGLAGNLALALEELEEMQTNRTQEMRRLKDNGVDFDSISLVRKSMLLLAPADLEECSQLSNEFKWYKDRLANLMHIHESTGNKLEIVKKEISNLNLQSKKMRNVSTGICILSAVITAAVFIIPQLNSLEALATIFLTSFVLSLIAVILLTPLLTNMRKELESKLGEIQAEQEKNESSESEMNASLTKIQTRADELSQKYKFSTTTDLFKKIQQYSTVSARLKNLDVLDQMIINRETQVNNLNKEAMSYFERANQTVLKMTPLALRNLASEILRHKENLREVERSTVVINHRISEKRFLEGEIVDLDSVLRDFFHRAKIMNPESIDEAYAEFEQKAQDYKKWESLTQELKRIETDVTSDILEHDLATVLNKLQHKRTDAWTQMQDLISLYPDILAETLEDSEIGRLGQGEEMSIEEGLIEKQAKVEALRSAIRTAARNFDEFYPKTQHELEVLERDLLALKKNKNALNLAREALARVAQESKTSWSHELAEIAAEVLDDSRLELRKIDWNENMEMTLTLHNQDQAIHESELCKIASKGLLKQLSWVIRMILCRYIARRLPLPIVLDEPFCDLDDKRYAACMELLVNKVLPYCQVIILTCQPVRHEWFYQKLGEASREKVRLVRAGMN